MNDILFLNYNNERFIDAMFGLYDKDSPLVTSFGRKQDDIRKLFREKVEGGACSVMHRHVKIGADPDLPESAWKVDNGDPVTKITFLDFNR